MKDIHWSSSERVLSMPARMGIGEVVELHRSALDAFRDSPVLRVDLSQVTEIDTAALQLLVSIRHTATAMGGTCEWRGLVPTAVRRSARLIGLYSILQFPSDARA